MCGCWSDEGLFLIQGGVYRNDEFLGSVNRDWQVEDEEDFPVGLIDPGRALVSFYEDVCNNIVGLIVFVGIVKRSKWFYCS